MLGRTKRPTRCRYVIAESEFADHQISLNAELTSSADGTLSNVRCCPAKLAPALSSSIADERTANGPPSGLTHLAISLLADHSPAAAASTITPESTTPGGTATPSRIACPNPTAYKQKSATPTAIS